MATIERAESEEAILACHGIMAELRPHVAVPDSQKTMRELEAEGLRLACVREHGRVVKALLAWLRRLAVECGCDVIHLDSGVQRKRAHAFYRREGLELAGYNFSERLKPRA